MLSSAPKFDDALALLLWAGDTLTKPTFANLMRSFEGWEWQSGLNRRLQRLQDRGLLRREKRAGQIVYELTGLGRLNAMGGADVVARWQRPWDGRWRQVLFDLPARKKKVRIKLWRWLRANGFGYLQNSVWVHPDPVRELVEALHEFRDDVETFLLMEASCCAGYSDAAIVAGAWDFTEINKRLRAYIQTVSLSARDLTSLRQSPKALAGWLTRERIAWRYVLDIDPLLPRALWPPHYEGERAWNIRLQSFRKLSPLSRNAT